MIKIYTNNVDKRIKESIYYYLLQFKKKSQKKKHNKTLFHFIR